MAKKKVTKSTRKKASKKSASRKSAPKKSTRKSTAKKSGRPVSRAPEASKPKGSDMQTRAVIGLIVNLLVPPFGIGTIIGGDTKSGVWQIVLFLIGVPLTLFLVGILFIIGAWIWALVSSVMQLQQAY